MPHLRSHCPHILTLTLASLSSLLIPYKVGVIVLRFYPGVPLLSAIMVHFPRELHRGTFTSSGQSVTFSVARPHLPLEHKDTSMATVI